MRKFRAQLNKYGLVKEDFVPWACSCCSYILGETISLKFCHQQAYSLSHRRYMCMETQRNDTDSRKPKNSQKKLSHCHFVNHKSHMDWLSRAQSLPSAVRVWWLTAWAMTRPVPWGYCPQTDPEFGMMYGGKYSIFQVQRISAFFFQNLENLGHTIVLRHQRGCVQYRVTYWLFLCVSIWFDMVVSSVLSCFNRTSNVVLLDSVEIFFVLNRIHLTAWQQYFGVTTR
jgi:hypothetical protein